MRGPFSLLHPVRVSAGLIQAGLQSVDPAHRRRRDALVGAQLGGREHDAPLGTLSHNRLRAALEATRDGRRTDFSKLATARTQLDGATAPTSDLMLDTAPVAASGLVAERGKRGHPSDAKQTAPARDSWRRVYALILTLPYPGALTAHFSFDLQRRRRRAR
jgi:hypothetical protein